MPYTSASIVPFSCFLSPLPVTLSLSLLASLSPVFSSACSIFSLVWRTEEIRTNGNHRSSSNDRRPSISNRTQCIPRSESGSEELGRVTSSLHPVSFCEQVESMSGGTFVFLSILSAFLLLGEYDIRTTRGNARRTRKKGTSHFVHSSEGRHVVLVTTTTTTRYMYTVLALVSSRFCTANNSSNLVYSLRFFILRRVLGSIGLTLR